MKSLTFLISALLVLGSADGENDSFVIVKVISDSASGLSCHHGWTPYGSRCFLYVPARLTWTSAEKFCLSMKANLASVHSYSEHLAIQRMIANVAHANFPAWLGGSDCQREGTWLWSDGTSFNYRYDGVFNNVGGNQHCLHMNFGSANIWNDLQCSHTLPFVCAKKRRTYG
uniref:C-type lectin domain-containing protein n=1 Tax=Nothobranchius furzeri TaxID=105023 RepID=A0A8C6LQH0_NOTFU